MSQASDRVVLLDRRQEIFSLALVQHLPEQFEVSRHEMFVGIRTLHVGNKLMRLAPISTKRDSESDLFCTVTQNAAHRVNIHSWLSPTWKLRIASCVPRSPMDWLRSDRPGNPTAG